MIQFEFHFFWIHNYILPKGERGKMSDLNYLFSPTSPTSFMLILAQQWEVWFLRSRFFFLASKATHEWHLVATVSFTWNKSRLKVVSKTSSGISDRYLFSLVKQDFLQQAEKPQIMACITCQLRGCCVSLARTYSRIRGWQRYEAKMGGRGRNRGDNKSEMHIPKKLAFPCTEGAGVL